MSDIRLAIVQHGDWLSARQVVRARQPEPYFGMTHAVTAIERMVSGRPHLLISLNADRRIVLEGAGRYVNMPRPMRRFWQPQSYVCWKWAGQMIRSLERFQPTHLLLRTGGVAGCRLLGWANRRRVKTLAVFANYFDRQGLKNRKLNEEISRRLNNPSVFLAGNHRWPATETMIECGVDPRKAVAWDWPGGRSPKEYPVKSQALQGVREIVYVGTLQRDKGIFDLMEGARLLNANGTPVRLTMIGDGAHAEQAKAWAAGNARDAISFTGRLSNDECFARMRAADLVCVPSRPEFTEGFPLTLTEALASRTPVLISTHPVFKRAFPNDPGVSFFDAGQPKSLAAAATRLFNDPCLYNQLSTFAERSFEKVTCKRLFGDVLETWKETMR